MEIGFNIDFERNLEKNLENLTGQKTRKKKSRHFSQDYLLSEQHILGAQGQTRITRISGGGSDFGQIEVYPWPKFGHFWSLLVRIEKIKGDFRVEKNLRIEK